MKRSAFLGSLASLPITVGATTLPSLSQEDEFDPRPGSWRTFEITTTVTLPPGGAAQAWVPIPSLTEAVWMRPNGDSWQPNDARIVYTANPWKVAMVHGQWNASSEPRRLSVVSRALARNRKVDFSRPEPSMLDANQQTLYTAATKFIPTDGIVKDTADKIVAGAGSDTEMARRIYDWVVTNSYRKPTTRGCGLGNIAFLLETHDIGGKCADINGLMVGLARSVGLPARDIYGIRVAPSEYGYKSLGTSSNVVTKAQHCRAEVHLSQFGWVPMDPADVRKVMLEEPPGNLSPNDPKVMNARRTLFGAWEGNYIAYNDGHDVELPGSHGDSLAFLMYPQAEVDGERLDSLDPANFSYDIKAEEIH